MDINYVVHKLKKLHDRFLRSYIVAFGVASATSGIIVYWCHLANAIRQQVHASDHCGRAYSNAVSRPSRFYCMSHVHSVIRTYGIIMLSMRRIVAIRCV